MPNYVAKIQTPDGASHKIGGHNFDGLWGAHYNRILTGVSLPAGGYISCDLSSYLPNDGFDYEVIVEAWGTMAGGVGNTRLKCSIGTNLTNNMYEVYIDNLHTLVNFTPLLSGAVRMVVPSYNKNILFSNSGSIAMTLSANINAYRRLGENNINRPNIISNINNIAIGGNTWAGQWITKYSTLFNGTIPASTTNTIDLSSYLPAGNNDCQWEILYYLILFGNNSGNTQCFIKSSVAGDLTLCSSNTINSLSIISNNNFVMPIGANRLLQIGNATSSLPITSAQLYARAYRRLGTNT